MRQIAIVSEDRPTPIDPARRAPRRRARWPVALGVAAVSVFAGLLLLALSEAELRWFTLLMAILVLVFGAVATDFRRAFLVYFVLALSVDAHYYLTTPPPMLFTGSTSPGALSIPLAMVPGLVLLGMRALFWMRSESDFRFAPEFTKPTLMMIGAALLAVLASPMKFTGICVVWQLGALYLLFLVTCNEVRSKRDADLLVATIMMALVGQALVFFLQLATGVKFTAVGNVMAIDPTVGMWHRATGTAAVTTAGFSTFMDPLATVAFAAYRTARTRGAKWTYGLLALLAGTVIILTLNRSSLLGLPLGIFVTEMLLRRYGYIRKTAMTAMSRLLLVGVLAMAVFLGAGLVQSKRGTDFGEDLDQRIALMAPSFSMIRTHPVLGVGPGVYGYELRNHAVGWTGWLYISHNDYLLIWAERGTLGFVAWLWWLWVVRREMLAPAGADASHVPIALGALGGFAAHLWEIAWTSCMAYPAYGIIYVLVGLCVARSARMTEPAPADAAAG